MVAAMRTLQPSGPYHLAGWSMGGVLAYEMARQLRQVGETVGLLALLDSYTPAALAQLDAGAGGGVTDVVAFAHDLGELSAMGGAVDASQEALLYAIFQANLRALQTYAPEPYDGPVHLLRCQLAAVDAAPADATSMAQRNDWAELVRGGLTVVEVPGDHYSILRMPLLEQVGERLLGWLGDGSVFAK
jgi:thioesterase domain-containing protein